MSESKDPPQPLSPEGARLLVHAACCVIAADGTIAQKEVDALLAAMDRLGIPHDPKATRAHAVVACKHIYARGVRLCAEELTQHVANSSSQLRASLAALTAELERADGTATAAEIVVGTVLESASHSAADHTVSGDQVEFGPLGDDDAAGKRNARSLGETKRFWPDLRDLNGAWLVGGLWSAIVVVTLVYSLVSNGPSLLHSASPAKETAATDKAKQASSGKAVGKNKNEAGWLSGIVSKTASPVDSWNQFINTAKSRIAGAETKWNSDNSPATRKISVFKDDVKRSDSLKSPFCGEITCKVWDIYGRNGQRALALETSKVHRAITSALQKAAFERGDKRKADDLLKELREIEARISEITRWSLFVEHKWEYNLRFNAEGESWILRDGDVTMTLDSMSMENVGRPHSINELSDSMLELFQ